MGTSAARLIAMFGTLGQTSNSAKPVQFRQQKISGEAMNLWPGEVWIGFDRSIIVVFLQLLVPGRRVCG
jgi:hypothetical protein